ncbi:MmcQ/YjbR family DNA-binding protein [Paenibacillus psychroresistens]|uniref:MmcQ/YjbR family DNA-binding protein n=2 Tax=Paenibacillus psychroresistens TaxID=1778678 RepID=A0A6B8RWA1_9BACL|nr:MmcQ/YjbR family DNA-binding protein [Paenibacillus psychroresistens]
MNEEVFDSIEDKALFERIRELCLSLPGSSERTSHGAPTFFIKDKKSFVQYHRNHHGDGKIALWCAAPSGVQMMLVESQPNIYYIPAYVGHLGWIGLRLDRDAAWEEIASVIGDAFLAKAPKKLIALLT